MRVKFGDPLSPANSMVLLVAELLPVCGAVTPAHPLKARVVAKAVQATAKSRLLRRMGVGMMLGFLRVVVISRATGRVSREESTNAVLDIGGVACSKM